MAIQRIDSINIDDATLQQDGVGGGGGTIPTNDIIIGQENTGAFSNLFVFNISSNETGFTTYVNGDVVGDNKRIRISRESLAEASKKIEVKKDGYINNEYYLIEMIDDGTPIIKNPNIEQPLGINTKDIVLTYYRNGQMVLTPQSIKNKVSSDLVFNLKKANIDVPTDSSKYKITFNISGKGSPVSILKNANKNAEFFPKVGISEYEDIDGTKYIIRSSDSTLYRVTKIYFNNEELLANAGESLELNVTLKDNYTFNIETEEVSQGTPAKDPQIQLVKDGAREYNINSKAGVPLMFRKNADVDAITVIVGEDVLEFDDLDKGDLCGITIPHSVFKNIGKYNIKIFPFSFDDYENQVRPAKPAERVETKQIKSNTKKKIVKEEVVIETPKVEDIYNPYNPTIGSGGRPITIDPIQESLNQTNNKPIPGGNDGSFVNRPVDNRNIR